MQLQHSSAYTYGDDSWGDLLTAYNGAARTYDQIGNLLTDGTWTYTWSNGRELASMTDGTTTWNYTYDANGMRTSRTNGTKTYSYVYNGSQLVQMTVGNDTLYFTYGALGPATVTWNGTTYYYGLNGQGDVIGIYDNTGYVVVTYNWDTAWGYNPMPEGLLASTLGVLNPLRYRSYVYDSETGYYYLQSRYYDPEIGRFINADGFVSTGQGLLGNNMFTYCGNNPVNRIDHTGQFWSALGEFFQTTVNEIGKAMASMAPAYAACSEAALLDGPLPFGDIVGFAGVALLTVGTIGYGIHQASRAPAIPIPKVEEKAEVIVASPPSPTVIYRYGGKNPSNLTPKAKDRFSGLSFSTVPMPGAAMTTIEALNATGVVYAVKDGPTHVSVRPVGASVDDWIKAGPTSIWTLAVKSVVINWDGKY